MPYELIWEDRGVVLRFWGVASDHDYRQSSLEFYGHPKAADIDYTLVDYTDVTKLDYSINFLRSSAASDAEASKRSPSMRVAIVGKEQLLLGLTNMYLTHFDLQGGTWEHVQFTTVDEARVWLAVEDRGRDAR